LVSYLEGAADWAQAATNWSVGEAEDRFSAIEPLAAGLSDDLLRRSVVLHLANRIETLTRDSNSLTARSHRLLNASSRRGIRGLNPGVAIGRLEIIDAAEGHAEIEPDRIYVIPATVAELKPMRGILTLDSGNALSHAQLLAANLGIPNSTVPSALLGELRAHRGEQMFYAVTPRGTVVLRPWSSLTPSERAVWEERKVERRRVAIDTSKIDTRDKRLRLLEETSMADSGVLCGPKAANLGQLKRLFPDHVAPGIVVPFGVYYEHAARKNASGASILDAVQAAHRETERMRKSGAAADALREYMRPRLAGIRRSIQTMVLDPGLVTELNARLRATFGPDGTYGVFVRSDTNAEDLPQFTGAGLNLTLPNVVGEAKIAQALKEVWASPFEERAWAWRSEALESNDQVYPSVVLLRTVPSDKSGVMATANLSTLAFTDLTVNVNEGVAAVVDGGVSESLLLEGNGEVRLLAQARAAYKKVPLPAGDYARVPASGSDYVLSGDEISQLRGLARDVRSRLKPAQDGQGAELPWDIEFGFEKGRLRLFQIRPLVRYREAKTLDALGALDSGVKADRTVPLDGAMERE
jgi:phosphoenolpyruvate synthase/pyruvate phosphate dikinase